MKKILALGVALTVSGSAYGQSGSVAENIRKTADALFQATLCVSAEAKHYALSSDALVSDIAQAAVGSCLLELDSYFALADSSSVLRGSEHTLHQALRRQERIQTLLLSAAHKAMEARLQKDENPTKD